MDKNLEKVEKNTTNEQTCPPTDPLEPLLSRVRVVLVGTTHSGNIGASARAMKTMGLRRLVLVDAKAKLDAEAFAMASNALDVMDGIQRVTTLDEGLQGCHWVIGASARLRDRPCELMSSRQMADHARDNYLNHPDAEIALVFGREHSGLTNQELGRCHAHMLIPANPVYSSLNLAQAVQIACYELRQSLLGTFATSQQDMQPLPATHDAIENLMHHWQETLHLIDFLDDKHPRHMMQKLRYLVQRAQITQNEVDILRGMLTAMQRNMNTQGNPHV